MRWVVVLSKFFDQGPNLTKNLPSISTQCFPRVTRAAKLSAGVEPWSLNLSNVTVTLVKDNLGTTLRHLLGNLNPTWGQLWDNLETSLRQIWSMRPQFVNCYCDLETPWGRLWHNFEATCKQREDNLGPWGLNLSSVTVTLVRDNLGTTLRHLIGNLKTTWGQLCDNLGTTLRHLWSMGPQFVNCYCDLETTWGRLWHNFVSTCKRLEDNLEPCMGPQFVNYHYVLLTIPTKPHIFWFWKHLPCAKP